MKAAREKCSACTTPRNCGTPALGDKGPQCARRAAGPDSCDCLNQCGDDPWLVDGRALPCADRPRIERDAAAAVIWSAMSANRLWTATFGSTA